MLGDGKRETLVNIDGEAYVIRVLDRPLDYRGLPCKTYLDHDTKRFDVMESLTVGEWFKILAEALHLPEGQVIWNAHPLVPIEA